MKIIGHEKQIEFLKQTAKLNKLSHAYLFSGQDKLGKKTIAFEWACLITGQPFKKQNPGFILIEPKNKTIQISQIRDLIWKLSLKSSFISPKIAIIDKAHLMGIDAQHALLKTLEEPKGDSILILITQKPELLFDTIRSRCEIIKFYPIKKDKIKKYLKKQEFSEKEIKEIIEFSRGRPGQAIEFILNPEKLKKQRKIVEELKIILTSSLVERFELAKELSQQDNLKEKLDIWLNFLRNFLIKQIKSENNLQSVDKTKSNLNLLQKINFLISTTNINTKLALETLLINI